VVVESADVYVASDTTGCVLILFRFLAKFRNDCLPDWMGVEFPAVCLFVSTGESLKAVGLI